MSLLVLGSIGIDDIQTPRGSVKSVPGGSAYYASLSASYFNQVSVVGVIGTDFNPLWLKELEKRNVDISGIKTEKGKSFRWSGKYENFNKAITLNTELNVFEKFNPVLSEYQKKSDIVFLGNIDPILQKNVLKSVKNSLVGIDTMNYWIKSKRDILIDVLSLSDVLFINEEEIKLLSEEKNVFKAIKTVSKYFKGTFVIKRGEYGSFIFKDEQFFFCPSYPVYDLTDTTGAGDSFAGAFLGYLSKKKSNDIKTYKTALLYATVMASFAVEGFSIFNLLKVNKVQIEDRFKKLVSMVKL